MAQAHEGTLSGTMEPNAPAIRDRFEAMVPAERPRLRALAWKFGLPADELDDAVQEVLSKAWAGLAQYRGDAELTTWVTRIAVHSFSSRKRSWVRRLRNLVLDPAAGEATAAKADRRDAYTEAYTQARVSILKLPPKLRAVFVLRYLEDMSCADVAVTLAIPEATVRTRVFHARKMLRSMMKGYEP